MGKKFSVEENLDRGGSSQRDGSAEAIPEELINVFLPYVEHEILERVVCRIEQNKTDITSVTKHWRKMLQVFANVLGEQGREYAHRISRFYQTQKNAYSEKETNNLFDFCLKNRSLKPGIGTFYHYVKAAGINISDIIGTKEGENANEVPQSPKVPQMPTCNDEEDVPTLPCIAKDVIKNLPPFLQDCLKVVSKPKHKGDLGIYHAIQDVVLLTTLAAVSSVAYKVRTMYRRRWYHPQIMLFIVAKAATGKGVMEAVKTMLNPIDDYLDAEFERLMAEYKRKMAIAKQSKGNDDTDGIEDIEEPVRKVFVIPTDITNPGLCQLLADNHCHGFQFDTEIDTASIALGSDWGDYSVLVRKNFEHEDHKYFRKTDRQYIYLRNMNFSAALGGQLEAYKKRMPTTYNGEFSRWFNYCITILAKWIDAEYDEDDVDERSYFTAFGEKVFRFWQKMEAMNEDEFIRFRITEKQLNELNRYFSKAHHNYIELEGEDMNAVVNRLATMLLRIAMVLTIIRHFDDDELPSEMLCSQKDFNTAMTIVKAGLQHSSYLFEQINGPAKIDCKAEDENSARVFKREDQQNLLMALPQKGTFTTHDFVAKAKELNIPESTAKKWIAKFVKEIAIICDTRGIYHVATADERKTSRKSNAKKKAKK